MGIGRSPSRRCDRSSGFGRGLLLLGALVVLCAGSCRPEPGPKSGPPETAARASAADDDHAYLGQPQPGATPGLFAPGLVSTDEAVELNGVVSPDGRELFFTRMARSPEEGLIFRMHRFIQWDDGSWRGPERVAVYPDDRATLAVDMAYSPDGQRLFFLGRSPHELSPEQPGLDLWVSERTPAGDWSLARPLPPPVWTEAAETYPVVGPDGTLQFSSDREGGRGASDLWRAAPLGDGGFAEPVNLGPPINTEHDEGDSAIGPDDGYVVFTSNRPGGLGNGDLYVSFRDQDGAGWGEPIHLGPGINTEHTDYCPMLTPDGRFLFFSRRVSEPPDAGWEGVVAGDVYWVGAEVIERLRR
ncbi:MAG TPA: hypothetical protein VMT85_14475 [Thermoanaerobaculia bacterium]|nr:hypothetical protein [Thermoanaerobaculia bacterium]